MPCARITLPVTLTLQTCEEENGPLVFLCEFRDRVDGGGGECEVGTVPFGLRL